MGPNEVTLRNPENSVVFDCAETEKELVFGKVQFSMRISTNEWPRNVSKRLLYIIPVTSWQYMFQHETNPRWDGNIF